MRSPQWSIPIQSRSERLPILHAIAFTVLFNSLIIVIFALLFVTFPLRAVSRRFSVWHQRVGKGLFGQCLVSITTLFFGQLDFVISTDSSDRSVEHRIERNAGTGEIVKVKVPKRSIWIANHQTLADWLFLWTFFYVTDSSPSLYIALKSSLKKIPIIGQACSWFGFAFLERNWSKDKVNFEEQLDAMARDCTIEGTDGKLDFLLFPEGTIVTENTRGISSKFAEKANLKDFNYTLLPRSTGLFFALRQLAVRVPSLELTDLTVGYPLPRTQTSTPLYPSEFYSLPSIFIHKVPPPELHFHLRFFRLGDIPLGDLSALKSRGKGQGDDGSEQEKKIFDAWLLERWQEKDDLLRRFNQTGSFMVNEGGRRQVESDDEADEDRAKGEYVWKPRLRSPVWESLQFVALAIVTASVLAWGLPVAWRFAAETVGRAKLGFSNSPARAGSVGCGCGKMNGGAVKGLRIERTEL